MSVADKKIFIAALARDCAKNLSPNIKRIEELRSFFGESLVVVVENDSVDGTKQILREWENTSNGVKIISEDYKSQTIPASKKGGVLPGCSFFRIDKMAKYRNIYLDYFKSLAYSFDYFLVIDADIVSFSVSGIIESLKNAPNDWGGLFAYGTLSYKLWGNYALRFFYDTYAFLGKRENLYGLKQSAARMQRVLYLLTFKLLFTKFYRCHSSFSGIAVYRAALMEKVKYECVNNHKRNNIEVLCEHMPVNYRIHELGYGNYISKLMEVDYGNCNIRFLLNFIFFNLPAKLYRLIS